MRSVYIKRTKVSHVCFNFVIGLSNFLNTVCRISPFLYLNSSVAVFVVMYDCSKWIKKALKIDWFPVKHFIVRFRNLPFELFLPSKEFSRKPFPLELTFEFAELILECSSEILISSSFEKQFLECSVLITRSFYFTADFLFLFKNP